MKSKVTRIGPDWPVQLVQLETGPESGPITSIELIHQWTGQRPDKPHGVDD